MPRVHTVKKARKDHPPDIKKGDTYYYWTFYGMTQPIKSKKYPKPWELTKSPYLSQLLQSQNGWQSIVSSATGLDDLSELVDDIKGEIDDLRGDCEASLESMPEHLQDTSDSGILLSDRINVLEEFESELDTVGGAIDSAKGDTQTADEEFTAGQLEEDEYENKKEEFLEEAKGQLEAAIDELEIN